MTDTTTADRERTRRISSAWDKSPTLDYDTIAREVDAQLVDEAETAALQAEKTRALSESLDRMTACPSCGSGSTLGNQSGLCTPCAVVATVIRNERAAAETVNGRSRREVVAGYLDRFGNTNR